MKHNVWKGVAWIPALTWMTLIFLLSDQPGGDSGRLTRIILEYLAGYGIDFMAWFGENAGFVLRKLAHFSVYGILFLLLYLGWSRWKKWPRSGWLALACTVLYAASDEFHQLFVPRRVGNIYDVLIDSAGALAALGLVALIRTLTRKRRQARITKSSAAK